MAIDVGIFYECCNFIRNGYFSPFLLRFVWIFVFCVVVGIVFVGTFCFFLSIYCLSIDCSSDWRVCMAVCVIQWSYLWDGEVSGLEGERGKERT